MIGGGAKLIYPELIFPSHINMEFYNTKEKKFIAFENGDNRLLNSDAGKKKITVLHDGFVHLPNNTWKGAGVAIPVFSLRSKKVLGWENSLI